MKRRDRGTSASVLACEVCGQLPHPQKVRLTLANVAVMLPIELVVHAAVVNTELPYGQKVLVLTLTATALVIWVAEPSVRRALRDWLHAPALSHRRRLHATPALWRIRTVIDDGQGAQQKLARGAPESPETKRSLAYVCAAGSSGGAGVPNRAGEASRAGLRDPVPEGSEPPSTSALAPA